MTPALAIAPPRGFTRHGHIYVPRTARERADLAWFSEEARKRRLRAGPAGRPTQLCSPGFFGGAYGGFFTAGGAATYDVWLRDLASATYYSGAAPFEIYDPGSVTSPNSIVGKVAGYTLAPVGTPSWEQVLTGAGGDPKGVGFANASSDSFDSADSSKHDVSTGEWARLVIFRDTGSTGTRIVFGKRDGALPYYGYELRVIAGTSLSWLVGGTGGARTSTITWVGDTDPHYAFCFRANGLVGMSSDLGAEMTWADVVGDASNTAVHAIGAQRLTAMGGVIATIVEWIGAAATAVVANRGVWAPTWAAATGAF